MNSGTVRLQPDHDRFQRRGHLPVQGMGIGMCCTMEWAGRWFVPGIIIGVIGIVMIALAYPLYDRITKKERKKIAPLILKLADELKSKE